MKPSFKGDHGIRSVSKFHASHPYIFQADGQEYRVDYEAAESTTGLFGGNSNWRRPVWLQINYLIIESLFEVSLLPGGRLQSRVSHRIRQNDDTIGGSN